MRSTCPWRKVGNQECDLPEAKRGKCFRKEGKASVTSDAVERWDKVAMEKWLLDSAVGATVATVPQQSKEARSLFEASAGMSWEVRKKGGQPFLEVLS